MMNELQRTLLLAVAVVGLPGLLGGCASTVVRRQTHHYPLTSKMLPVCKATERLAVASVGDAIEAVPVVAMQPQYPAVALNHHVNGVVALGFTIDQHGKPCDVALIYSAPDGLFVPVAVEALVKSEFQPKTVDGKPVLSRATFTYTFRLPPNLGGSGHEPKEVSFSPNQPSYPMAAWLDRVEGFVKFRFTVEFDGHPENPVVLKSEPAGVFDKAAARALMHSRFKIEQKDGKAVPYDATFTYRFSLKPHLQAKPSGQVAKK
ncbi:MAG TPA: energy transducer TonB [Gammaproteobacteria bacterium]|nr:energy transducer TonB [Gammaproteobacteria bacterium]